MQNHLFFSDIGQINKDIVKT